MYQAALKVAETMTQEELKATIRYTSNATLQGACEEVLKRREAFQK